MRDCRKVAARVCVGFTAFLIAAATASAQTPEGFYKGRTISILMGTGPGGSYDIYGRVIAAHIARHIPGNPNIIVEHMPGAGGANAGNFIFGPAPQDGSKILLSHSLPLVEALSPGPGIRFKSREFQWLGAYDEIVQVMAIWNTVGVKTIDDLKSKDFVVGSMGTQHLTYQWATLLKSAIDAKFRVISGYKSGGSLNVAMEKGEINCWTASWENLVASRPQWLKDKQITMPVVFTLERTKDLPDVPTLIEISKGETREIAELLSSGTPMARALLVGPKVPADRVAALRKAMADLMKDKDFIAEAEKRKLGLNYRTPDQVAKLVDKIVLAKPEFLAKVRKAVSPPAK
jgi:tripartite-type tricarboxylate transporter receptor subunit TctC